MQDENPPIIDQPYAPPAAALETFPRPAATPTGIDLLIGVALIWGFEFSIWSFADFSPSSD